MEIPRHWRLKKQRYALIGEVCSHCENKIFPPRVVCPECGNNSVIEIEPTNPFFLKVLIYGHFLGVEVMEEV